MAHSSIHPIFIKHVLGTGVDEIARILIVLLFFLNEICVSSSSACSFLFSLETSFGWAQSFEDKDDHLDL